MRATSSPAPAPAPMELSSGPLSGPCSNGSASAVPTSGPSSMEPCSTLAEFTSTATPAAVIVDEDSLRSRLAEAWSAKQKALAAEDELVEPKGARRFVPRWLVGIGEDEAHLLANGAGDKGSTNLVALVESSSNQKVPARKAGENLLKRDLSQLDSDEEEAIAKRIAANQAAYKAFMAKQRRGMEERVASIYDWLTTDEISAALDAVGDREESAVTALNDASFLRDIRRDIANRWSQVWLGAHDRLGPEAMAAAEGDPPVTKLVPDPNRASAGLAAAKAREVAAEAQRASALAFAKLAQLRGVRSTFKTPASPAKALKTPTSPAKAPDAVKGKKKSEAKKVVVEDAGAGTAAAMRRAQGLSSRGDTAGGLKGRKSKDDKVGEASYVRARLKLDDAIAQGNFDGWSPARIRAWQSREVNPNAYYYRFNAPGEQQMNGAWNPTERAAFFKRAEELGISGQWGIFSMTIPGRVGYQCSNFYRKLLENGEVTDENYYLDERGKAHYIFSSKRDAGLGGTGVPRPKTKSVRVGKSLSPEEVARRAQEKEELRAARAKEREAAKAAKEAAKAAREAARLAAKKAREAAKEAKEAAREAEKRRKEAMRVKVREARKEKKVFDETARRCAASNRTGTTSVRARAAAARRESRLAARGGASGGERRSRYEFEGMEHEEYDGEDELGGNSSGGDNEGGCWGSGGSVMRQDALTQGNGEPVDPEVAKILSGFVDPITLEPISKPAMSPFGHVMEYESWMRILTLGPTKGVCPLTKNPLSHRDIIVLTADNLDMYKSQIISM